MSPYIAAEAPFTTTTSFGTPGISYPGSSGGQLIPGMGGMNPTGVDPLNPTATSTGLASSGLSGAPGDATIGGGSGVMAMPTPVATTIGGGSTTDTSTIASSTTGTDPTTNAGLIPGTNISSGFTANTAGTVGGAGTSGISSLDLGSLLGFNVNDPNLKSELDNMFGSGVGDALMSFLGGGAGYSPAIATALINQMAPQEERTRNQILESFGASGGRYSSPAAIGLGDYESSYSLGQQGILANLAQSATQNYTNLFSGLVDTAYLTQANKLSPWNIISGIIGMLPSLGISIPGVGGKGGSGGAGGAGGAGGPAGAPGKTGPAGTTTTQPQGSSTHTISPVYTDPATGNVYDNTTGNVYDSSGNLIGTGGVPGTVEGNLSNIPAAGYSVDYSDPFGIGQTPTTPTVPIDSSTQYTSDTGTTDWFGL